MDQISTNFSHSVMKPPHPAPQPYPRQQASAILRIVDLSSRFWHQVSHSSKPPASLSSRLHHIPRSDKCIPATVLTHLPPSAPAASLSTLLLDVASEAFTGVFSGGVLADSLSWYVLSDVSEDRVH
jgi:hypothetical protein